MLSTGDLSNSTYGDSAFQPSSGSYTSLNPADILTTTADIKPDITDIKNKVSSPSSVSTAYSTTTLSHYPTANMLEPDFRGAADYSIGALTGFQPAACATSNSYTTLTPLQPLPPISTVSDKFRDGNMNGSFTLMNSSNLASPYDKLNMGGMAPNTMLNGYAHPQSMGGYGTMGTPHHASCGPQDARYATAMNGYDQFASSMSTMSTQHHMNMRGLQPPAHHQRTGLTNPMVLNGLGHAHGSPTGPVGGRMAHDRTTNSRDGSSAGEEINTKEVAARVTSELKRYSIPQAVFAQRVLCRSQGTLSDLLRNPKPWSKLKSGRETFRRMWKWLAEPEFQRMSALRLAACKKKEEDAKSPPSNSHIKKPRLVFTDIQRRTLHAIFKETKRPSKEMQMTIAQQLGLELSTVSNFFMNARRRSIDKWQDGENGQTSLHNPCSPGSLSPGTPTTITPKQEFK
ncbi:LOW QUALITY PROTEIN: one cut domain family member 2-like [Amphiura filiformis]|uniref:LOW QUALITY PROTEIN: one cut domain family member 2-like n=1 Tax=Amphiura filiformis TaxID=82378 RepID=UPI003B22265F